MNQYRIDPLNDPILHTYARSLVHALTKTYDLVQPNMEKIHHAIPNYTQLHNTFEERFHTSDIMHTIYRAKILLKTILPYDLRNRNIKTHIYTIALCIAYFKHYAWLMHPDSSN